MATSTTRLGLTKPDGTDLVDIAVLNTNANKIDAAVGAFVCTSTTRPSTPYSGQIIYETDTDQSFVWDSATSTWNVLTPGATVCTSASRPASPVPGQVIYETDTKLTYVYASGTWAPVVNNKAVSAFSPIRVADAAARDALFTAPTQGDRVFRVDTAVEETYYGLYNNPANLGGRDSAGWYRTTRTDGLVPIQPTSVTVSGGSASANALGVVTFTSVLSLKLNNVFSANFLNYKVLIDVTTGPATDNVNLVMRMDGAGATSYFNQYIRQYASSLDAFVTASTNQWVLGIAGRSGGAGASADVTIYKPFAAANTKYNSHLGGNSTSAGEQQQMLARGRLNDTSSYTGMEIFLGSSNMSGTIQVFGYNF